MRDPYDIKAKHTLYGETGAAIWFRSGLEARWALAFDLLRIDWQYEPRRFRLRGGFVYTPDFYLGGIGYIEIKPHFEALQAVESKLKAFARQMDEVTGEGRLARLYSIDAAEPTFGRSGPQLSSVIEWTPAGGVRCLPYREALATVCTEENRAFYREYPDLYADHVGRIFRYVQDCHLHSIEPVGDAIPVPLRALGQAVQRYKRNHPHLDPRPESN